MTGAFNRMPFNRPATIEVQGSFVVDLSGNVLSFANVVASPSFLAGLTVETVFEAIRERLGSFLLEAAGEIETTGLRERLGSFAVQAELEVSAHAGRYHVDVIRFTDDFAPGDQIVIDMDRLRMTLNGQNALHLMEGDFFRLITGKNELVYTDEETGRTVRMRITFRDRYV